MNLEKPLNLTFAKQGTSAPRRSLESPEHTSDQSTEALKNEIQAKNRLIEAKDQEISELKARNQQLRQENQETQERQKLMDEELRKAEAQIELIMELINEPKNEISDN